MSLIYRRTISMSANDVREIIKNHILETTGRIPVGPFSVDGIHESETGDPVIAVIEVGNDTRPRAGTPNQIFPTREQEEALKKAAVELQDRTTTEAVKRFLTPFCGQGRVALDKVKSEHVVAATEVLKAALFLAD